MTITTTELFDRILAAAPAFSPAMEKHLADNGELLPHVLMGDVGRFIGSYFTGETTIPGGIPSDKELRDVLSTLELSLIDGDEEAQNVVAVSFLEGLSVEPYYIALRSLLGPSLREEIQRQMTWRAG